MKKKFLKRVLIPAVLMMSLVFVLAACGETKESETEAVTENVESETETTTPETTTEEVKLNSIGKEEGSNVSFELTNETGKDIVGVRLNSSDDETPGENLLDEDDKFENNETRIVYLNIPDNEALDTDAETTEGDEANEETSAEAKEDEKELTTEYQVEITLDDDSVYTLHAFPVLDIKEGSIKVEDETAYIEYKRLEGDETISTLNAESAIKESEIETAGQVQTQGGAAPAQPDAAVPAQTQAATAPAQSEVAAPEQTQAPTAPAQPEVVAPEQTQAPTEPAQPDVAPAPAPEPEPVYEEPVYDEPAAPAQDANDDGCVGDGLFY